MSEPCRLVIPALFSSTSSRPYLSTAARTIASASALSVTSPLAVAASPPPSPIFAAVSSALDSLRSATTTRAPSRANASADARPIPDPPPVTRATFPSSLIESLLWRRWYAAHHSAVGRRR